MYPTLTFGMPIESVRGVEPNAFFCLRLDDGGKFEERLSWDWELADARSFRCGEIGS